MGDFNINIATNNNAIRNYKNIFTEYNYQILNKTTQKHYTRKNATENHSILDHVITNIKRNIKIKIIPTDISDHYAIKAELRSTTRTLSYRSLEITTTNYKRISEEIQNITETEIDSFEKLSTTLQKIIEKNQITKKIKRRDECPWINQDLIKQIKIRNKLYKQYRKYPQNEHYKTDYNTAKSNTSDMLRKAKKEYYSTKFEKYKLQTAKTWNIINKELNTNRKTTKDIEKIEQTDGTIVSNAKQIADEINKYFTNIGKQLAKQQIANSKK